MEPDGERTKGGERGVDALRGTARGGWRAKGGSGRKQKSRRAVSIINGGLVLEERDLMWSSRL